MPTFAHPTPVLRIFDEAKAKEFYLDFLGCTANWEHRFDDNAPLYMEVQLGDCILHLTGHHGDCSPGGALRIETTELEAFSASLLAKNYRYARPGCPNEDGSGGRNIILTDPFGNRLIFFERLAD